MPRATQASDRRAMIEFPVLPRDSKPAPEGWDEYWRRTREAAAHRGGGPQDEVLARFWATFFDAALARPETTHLLDLGCGNGAVARFALQAVTRAGRPAVSVLGVDSSLPALNDLRKRFPSVPVVAADAQRIPFPDGSFDVVSSQFGLEYAGVEAFSEAARLVAAAGTLAAVIHLKDGALYRECAVNLEALSVVRECGILPATREVFRAGHALARGNASRAEFSRADEELATAARKVDELLGSRGEAVAGGAVYRLYADIAHMYGRMRAYEPGEVATWADAMAREVEAYAGRMSSMLAAAIDAQGLDEVARRATSRGLSVRVREELCMGTGGGEPAAWVLVCDRR